MVEGFSEGQSLICFGLNSIISQGQGFQIPQAPVNAD
jgi:hypothetical protein